MARAGRSVDGGIVFDVVDADGFGLGAFRRLGGGVAYELSGPGFSASSVEHESAAAGIVQALGVPTLGSTTFVDPGARMPLLRTMGGARPGSHDVLVDDPRVDARLAAAFVGVATTMRMG